jgi:hypothetical protein
VARGEKKRKERHEEDGRVLTWRVCLHKLASERGTMGRLDIFAERSVAAMGVKGMDLEWYKVGGY